MPKQKQKLTTRVAVYIRVSSKDQKEASQRHENQRYLDGHGISDARWFVDKKTGGNLNRPAFEELQAAVFNGEIKTVIVWKLDRLSRKLKDGINVVIDWCEKGVRLVSVTQQLDLSGTIGQTVAAVLFGLAQCELEHNKERRQAGIDAERKRRKEAGIPMWGGASCVPRKVTPEKIESIRHLLSKGTKVTKIAKTVSLSRMTVYRVIKAHKLSQQKA